MVAQTAELIVGWGMLRKFIPGLLEIYLRSLDFLTTIHVPTKLIKLVPITTANQAQKGRIKSIPHLLF